MILSIVWAVWSLYFFFPLPLLPVIHQYHSTLLDQASPPFVMHSPGYDRMCFQNDAGILFSVWVVLCVCSRLHYSMCLHISLWLLWAASKANWHHLERSAATKACAWALNSSSDTFLSSLSPCTMCRSNASRSFGVGTCNTISSCNAYVNTKDVHILFQAFHTSKRLRTVPWMADGSRVVAT